MKLGLYTILIFFQIIYFRECASQGQTIRIRVFKAKEIPLSWKPFVRDVFIRPPDPRVNTKTNLPKYNFDKPEDRNCRTPENKRGICMEFSQCAQLYHNLLSDINDWHIYKCWISGSGEFKPNGFCCPIQDDYIPASSSPSTISTTSTTIDTSTNFGTKSEEDGNCQYINSHAYGKPCFENVAELNATLLQSSLSSVEQKHGKVAQNQEWQEGTRLGYHLYDKVTTGPVELSEFADILLETSKELADRMKLENGQRTFGLRNVNANRFPELSNYCSQNPICSNSKYRSIDGACNNLRVPREGQALTPLRRMLPPAYADGLQAPRVASNCSPLPNVRILSRSLFRKKNIPTEHSFFFVQFWQFLFSDLGSTESSQFDKSGIECCRNGQFLTEELLHKRCNPIEIPIEDPLNIRENKRCSNFVRATLSPRIDCSLGYADQLNMGTHWVDLSNLYGSNLEEANELRLYRNGLLRFSKTSGNRNLLPLRETPGDGCTIPERGVFCFQAGDRKVNEWNGLLVTHLLWLREHNRIATELKSINVEWSDEELYQEARRIVVAEYQQIIYNEWLPLFIGKNNASKRIDQNVQKIEGDNSVSNEFFSAAFRIDHSLRQGITHLTRAFGRSARFSQNPHSIRSPGHIDKWIRQLLRQPSQFNESYHEDIGISSEQPGPFDHEPDWGSYIIQRGREVGLPGYNIYRELCYQSRAKSFEDMNDLIDDELITILKRHYKSVDDVDLWIGGFLEKPLSGQFVGPTFACIIDDQFFKSRKGDRYFYDNRDELHSFSDDQLSEIRKTTFARVICDNGDNISETQPSAFLLPNDKTNPIVSCSDIQRIAKMDLSVWENEPTPPETIRST